MGKRSRNDSSFLRTSVFWKKFAQILLPGLLLLIVFMLLLFRYVMPLSEQRHLERTKNQISYLSDVAITIIDTQYNLVKKGLKDPEVAQRDAINRIRIIHYGADDLGYFWIQSNKSTILSHPLGEAIGNKTPETVDPEYREILAQVLDMSEIVFQTRENSFIEYNWYNTHTQSYGKKLSFLRYYAPWDWVLGTGSFIDDIRRDNDYLIALVINYVIILSVSFFAASLILSVIIVRSNIRAASIKNRLDESENIIRFKDEQFESMFLVSPFPIMVMSLQDDSILKVNNSFCQTSGYTEAEIIGKSPLKTALFSAEDFYTIKTVPAASERTLQSGLRNFLCNMRCKNDVNRIVMVSGVTIHYGSTLAVLMMLADITEQKQMQEQLFQARKMDTVGQLAGGIAHDFNNMLAGILGSAELLDHTMNPNEPLRKYVGIIIEASRRASDLTKKLLTFSRRERIISTPLDVHDSIRAAIALLKRSIDKRIEIRENLTAGNSVIEGDTALLQNAFLNIALNARDAMYDGGILSFTTETVSFQEYRTLGGETVVPGDYIRIIISDTGIGIPPENIPRIFDPFFTTKAVGQGTGLGLAAVFGTVKEHKGTIYVNSKASEGTTFTMLFPLSRLHTHNVPGSPAETLAGKGRILVVDDEEFVRSTTQAMLAEMGFETLVARDGAEALEMYRREYNSIDAVLLDMVMPKMNGRETFGKIRALNPGAKIIFISGFSPEGIGTEDPSLEECPFVQKPYTYFELNRAIALALSGKASKLD